LAERDITFPERYQVCHASKPRLCPLPVRLVQALKRIGV
jgi:hypothetical protein